MNTQEQPGVLPYGAEPEPAGPQYWGIGATIGFSLLIFLVFAISQTVGFLAGLVVWMGKYHLTLADIDYDMQANKITGGDQEFMLSGGNTWRYLNFVEIGLLNVDDEINVMPDYMTVEQLDDSGPDYSRYIASPTPIELHAFITDGGFSRRSLYKRMK